VPFVVIIFFPASTDAILTKPQDDRANPCPEKHTIGRPGPAQLLDSESHSTLLPSGNRAYPSEPFTIAANTGKLVVGEAMAIRGTSNQRRGSRTKAVLPVRVKGIDAAGESFEELVHTLDLTPDGARLGSLRRNLNVLDEVTVFFRQRKIQFRVIWTKQLKGTAEFQVGLRAVVLDKEAWGLGLPEQKAQSAASQASGAA
jgi:hypothetical protein